MADEQKKDSGIYNHTEEVSSLRTFQSDIAHAIKDKQGSVVKIAVQEEERKRKEHLDQSIESPKNKRFLVFGIVLFLFALCAVGVYLFYFNKEQPTFVKKGSSLTTYATIKADTIFEITLDPINQPKFFKEIADRIAILKTPKNGIERIVLTQKNQTEKSFLTANDLLTLLDTRTTPALKRSFDNNILFAVYISDTNTPFLILKTTSYPSSFSGMLSWERGMYDDLKDFLHLSQIDIENPVFIDKVVKNQDTRVLQNKEGETILLYTFIGDDQSLLLISPNEQIVEEVTKRLTQATTTVK